MQSAIVIASSGLESHGQLAFVIEQKAGQVEKAGFCDRHSSFFFSFFLFFLSFFKKNTCKNLK